MYQKIIYIVLIIIASLLAINYSSNKRSNEDLTPSPPVWGQSITTSKYIQKKQWKNLLVHKYGHDSNAKANPLLGVLDLDTLCTPICQHEQNVFHLTSVIDASFMQPACESTKPALQKYFTGGYALLHNPLSLAIVIPLLQHKKKLDDFFSSDAFSRCNGKQSAVGLVILTDRSGTPAIPYNVQQCFARVDYVKVRNKSSSSHHSKLSSFLQLLSNYQVVQSYKYIFWVDDALHPSSLQHLWIELLEKETQESSPFYIKGSPKVGMDGTDYLQSSFSFSTTLDSLMMDQNFVLGLWNGKFVNFTRALLSETLEISNLNIEDNIAKLMLTYMLHNNCNAKLFLPYIQYRNLVGSLQEQFAIFTKKVDLVAQNAHDRDPIHSLFSEEEIRCGDSLAKETAELLTERQYDVARSIKLRKSCLGNLNLPAIHSKQHSLQSGFIQLDKRTSAVKQDDGPRNRILLTIVFGGRQYKSLLYSLARWELSAYSPCDENSSKFTASLMFLQSGTEGEDVLDQLEMDIPEFPAISRCFSRVHYRFLNLPQSEYNDGPPNMFREMILGKYADQYDYVMQFEPDMFPIRPLWLEKIYNETLDTAPFWVKGTVGMYHDLPDLEGGCMLGTKVNETHAIQRTPLGTRLLHINGNALYSLSSAFREYVEEFFKWAETSKRGCNCPRHDRIHCFSGSKHCIGSFDTSLADYFFLSGQRIREQTLVHYRYSPMVANSMDPQYFPGCIADDTYFVHKAWNSFSYFPYWFQACPAREPYFKEFHWYTAYGGPESLILTFNKNSHPRDFINMVRHIESLFEIVGV